MKKLIILFLIILISTAYSQTKYLIYFKDKGIEKSSSLRKTSTYYNETVNSLSEKSIERRKKSMGNNYITYEDIPIKKEYLEQLTNARIKIVNKLRWFNAVSAYLNDDQENEVLKLSFVDKVEPVKILKYKRTEEQESNFSIKKSIAINNYDYGSSLVQYNLENIPPVHLKGITGNGITIGLLDSGFRWKTHEALSTRKVISEYDFVFNDSLTSNQENDIPDQDSHGTGVFSIIGGFAEGKIIGPAFDANYILAKTEDERSETHIEEDNYARALIWMDSIGVDVTSSSLGYSTFDAPDFSYTYADMDGKTTIVTKAAEMAFQRGILTMTAAGNEGNSKWHYITAPADGFNTIGVGAVDNSNRVAGFSGRGPSYDGRIKPDITAQGVDVFHADPSDTNSYGVGGGTSYAAPIAAGCAALLLSAYPYLTNVQARDILLRTSGNFNTPDNDIGYGLVSAANAISFPNIESVNGQFKLHKIFINQDKIIPGSVHLNYFVNGADTSNLEMNYDGKLKYEITLPILQIGNKINFYFTYSDSAGQYLREPENTDYILSYGDVLIETNRNAAVTEPAFLDSVLDQNRPNPFNSRTKIRFYSAGNENTQIVVYNILGKKIKVLFDGISKKDVNTVYWDGSTSWGIRAASGVYIYTLNLGGKFYSKKMIYLK
jgi:serine protease AprX